MKHRDRVLTALNHEIPDRCPMQISFTPEFAVRLAKEIDLGSDKIHNPHGGGNTYELERALDQDMLLTSVGWANSYYQEADEYVDEWGIGWRSVEYSTPYGVGRYTEFPHHPLADEDAIDTTRQLGGDLGLLVGISSGANVWAARKLSQKINGNVITVLADRAERYFSTALL